MGTTLLYIEQLSLRYFEQGYETSYIITYLRVGACTSFLVLLLAGPLVKLSPECLGLPVVETGLKLVVEDPVLTGLELQMVTELLEGLERAFTGGGLGEAVKHYVGRVHPLPCGGEASRIPHGPHGPATLSGASGQAPAPGSSTHSALVRPLAPCLKHLRSVREREDKHNYY